MEPPRQLFDTRVNVFLGDTTTPSSKAFVVKPSIRTQETSSRSRRPLRWAQIGFGGLFVADGRIETDGGWNP